MLQDEVPAGVIVAKTMQQDQRRARAFVYFYGQKTSVHTRIVLQ